MVLSDDKVDQNATILRAVLRSTEQDLEARVGKQQRHIRYLHEATNLEDQQQGLEPAIRGQRS